MMSKPPIRNDISARLAGAVPGLAAAALVALVPVAGTTASPLRVDQLIRTALELEPNQKRGAAAYGRHCAACHGEAARGNPAELIPALASQRQAYLIKQLADFTEMEREGPAMHDVVARAALSEPQVWADIAGYLSGLPPAPLAQTGDGSGVALGEAIYREQCASCHEEDARGDDEGFIPSLRDQHYSYLLRQMRGLATWHRANVEEDLVRFMDSLDNEELTATADYLSRLRSPSRDRAKLRDDGTVSD